MSTVIMIVLMFLSTNSNICVGFEKLIFLLILGCVFHDSLQGL